VRILAAIDRAAVGLVVAAAVLPRLAVLAIERGSILSAYTEKSDDFATTFVASGTYGFIPGHPSAYTQPLYGFFLVPIYWIFGRSWEAVGIAQIAVATATALLVYAIGRHLLSRRFAALAAIVATLNPYLIWHDVHVNREIVDQLVLAALVLATLRAVERRSIAWAAGAGALTGVAILGNSRLIGLPLVIAVYFVLRRMRRPVLTALVVLAAATAVVTPWVVRNRIEVGCFAITTDGRALWKANNPATYATLAAGKWIDDVPQPSSFPPSPESAAVHYRETGELVPVDECKQMNRFEHLVINFWEDHPGEKAKLMGQSAELLWDPRVHETEGRSGKGTWRDTVRRVVEPVWAIPVFALALVGLWFAPMWFAALAGVLLAYNTFAAMVFAGTTRYRVPFDFLAVLLACAAVSRLASRRRYTAETPSAAASSEN
jgi:4-amino-4-deoxy-L-arabinose transferase-like glycosyltransferase